MAFGCVRVDWTKKSNFLLLVCLWVGFLSLASYLVLGTALKSARQQPEFGLSGLALNAKPKSAAIFLYTLTWRLEERPSALARGRSNAIGRYLANRVTVCHIDGSARCGEDAGRMCEARCCDGPIFVRVVAGASQCGRGAVCRNNPNAMVVNIRQNDTSLAVESAPTRVAELCDVRLSVPKALVSGPSNSVHNSNGKFTDSMVPCIWQVQCAISST